MIEPILGQKLASTKVLNKLVGLTAADKENQNSILQF